MTDKKDDIQAKLRALYEVYVAQFPAKFEEIDRYWQSLMVGDNNNQENIRTLHCLVHSLAGSCAKNRNSHPLRCR